MVGSYLKIAVRTLLRRKALALVSVGGLAIGMACALLLLLYVQYELSYDRFPKHSDRIYRLILERKGTHGAGISLAAPPPMAPALCAEFPQIVTAVRLMRTDNPVPFVRHGETRFYEKGFLFADPQVADVFSLHFVAGDAGSALVKPNAVVITEETARRYFGEGDALGKTLSWNGQLDFEVTGVVQSPPPTSTLQFDLLASFATLPGWAGKDFVENWANNSFETYILLSEPAAVENIRGQLPSFVSHRPGLAASIERVMLQPLQRIHLYSWKDFGLAGDGGDIREVSFFAGIAFLILIIASVSFFGLTTARLTIRGREVGVRRMLGAGRGQLFAQFMGEAAVSCLAALLGACMLVEMALPSFSALIGRDLTGYYGNNLWWGLIPAAIVLVVAAASGGYPAFVLSFLHPVQALSGRLGVGRNRLLFWKVLVLFQCALAVALVLASWIVHGQIAYLQQARLGIDKDHVLIIPFNDERVRANPETFKSKLLGITGVMHVAAVGLLPGGPVGHERIMVQGRTESLSELWVDHDFLPAIGATLVAGRNFVPGHPGSGPIDLILNEEAARQLGWPRSIDAVGNTVDLGSGGTGTVVGVVQDFNFLSLRYQIGPLVLRVWPWPNYLLVRLDGSRLPGLLNTVQEVWTRWVPGAPFTYTFLNENFDRHYDDDRRLARLLNIFTLLATFIALTGLLSLITFVTERRVKEIGIRRVFGASVLEITGSLTREILLLVFLANLLAGPVIWLFMEGWLDTYAFHRGIHIDIFLLAGAGSLLAAILTVGFRAVKAALARPVDALRES